MTATLPHPQESSRFVITVVAISFLLVDGHALPAGRGARVLAGPSATAGGPVAARNIVRHRGSQNSRVSAEEPTTASET